jgi:hypothetical protein
LNYIYLTVYNVYYPGISLDNISTANHGELWIICPKHDYFPDISAYESRTQSNDMSRIVEAVELVPIFNLSQGYEVHDQPIISRAGTGSSFGPITARNGHFRGMGLSQRLEIEISI